MAVSFDGNDNTPMKLQTRRWAPPSLNMPLARPNPLCLLSMAIALMLAATAPVDGNAPEREQSAQDTDSPPLPDLASKRLTIDRPLPVDDSFHDAIYRLELDPPADDGDKVRDREAGDEDDRPAPLGLGDLPRAGWQRPVFSHAGTLILVVDGTRPANPAADTPHRHHREPAPRVPSDHEALAKAAAAAVEAEPEVTDSLGRAALLKQAVTEWLADEAGHEAIGAVERGKEVEPLGESATAAWALAAALRSQQIPARIVVGLVYEEQVPGEAPGEQMDQAQQAEDGDPDPVFAFRMWVQAWAGGDEPAREGEPEPLGARWVDIDAITSANHAGRIAIAHDMLDGEDLEADARRLDAFLERLRLRTTPGMPQGRDQ